MSVNLTVPEAGESIAEVRIGAWLKSEGEFVTVDEVVVELETDKAAIELPAPVSGTLVSIVLSEGADAAIGDVIGVIDETGTAPPTDSKPSATESSAAQETQSHETAADESDPEPHVMPSAKRVLGQAGVAPAVAKGTGPGGRVLKEDAVRAVKSKPARPDPTPTPEPAPAPTATGLREEEIVSMTPLRKVIARNLVAAQQTAALLTTFNEVDMSAVIALRKRHKDAFLDRHGIKLGFMSFFVKAAVDALQTVPAVNARVDGTEIVYRKYQDIGIAVGGGRGLVVPVLRNADSMSFAAIELAIADFAKRAAENYLPRILLSERQDAGADHGRTLEVWDRLNDDQKNFFDMKDGVPEEPSAIEEELFDGLSPADRELLSNGFGRNVYKCWTVWSVQAKSELRARGQGDLEHGIDLIRGEI